MADTTTDLTTVKQFRSLIQSSERDKPEKVRKLYDDWTPSYDEDVKAVSYTGPKVTGSIVSQYLTDKSASILDAGAGTGLVAEVLYSLGYKNITGIDISQKSLDIAKAKNVYSRLICSGVGEKQMPFEENEFDAIVCSGCFVPGHMNQKCFPDWIRIVKTGGLITLVMRESHLNEEEFKDGFPKAVQELVDSNSWRRVATQLFPGYFDNHPGIAFVFEVL